ncbi:MAG: 1-acyl-sn-glycerol-3-phosphate acyltransferase [Planctomycetes bacterium]|nr:1-acyl-sn-glycerol-3-phosphate acyltransferase [Planctomycetota bacterium]
MRRIVIKIIQLSLYGPFLFLFRCFLGFKVEGGHNLLKAGDSFILAVNHISYLDPMLVSVSFPFRSKYIPLFYMADDLFYKVLFFYRFVGGIRTRKSPDLALSCGGAIDKLESGERVVIFPEGSIRRGKKIRPRRGVSYIAAKSGKLVVPLKIESNLDGTISVLGGRMIDLFTWKHRVKMVFGEPFMINETIGKMPESLSELRLASKELFRRIETANVNTNWTTGQVHS